LQEQETQRRENVKRNRLAASFCGGILALMVVAIFASWHARAQNGPAALSRVAGTYFSPAYKDWGASIAIGNSATGSQTVTVCPGFVALRDGRPITPFSTTSPLTFDAGSSASAETVTPSAVSLVSPPAGYSGGSQCAQITATFSNTHGASLNPYQVISGDAGIQEAINDASNNGGGMVYWEIDPGIVALNTGGANTTLGSVNIPTRSTVMGATAKVTTTIATCAGGWSLGFSSGTEFSAANTTLTAGTTTDSSTLSPAVAFNAAATAPIAHCTTSNASAGAIHAKFWGYKQAAPAN
jgi:hypothetical protein